MSQPCAESSLKIALLSFSKNATKIYPGQWEMLQKFLHGYFCAQETNLGKAAHLLCRSAGPWSAEGVISTFMALRWFHFKAGNGQEGKSCGLESLHPTQSSLCFPMTASSSPSLRVLWHPLKQLGLWFPVSVQWEDLSVLLELGKGDISLKSTGPGYRCGSNTCSKKLLVALQLPWLQSVPFTAEQSLKGTWHFALSRMLSSLLLSKLKQRVCWELIACCLQTSRWVFD